jgi:hypothetical protein
LAETEKKDDLSLSAGHDAKWWAAEIKKSVKDWDKARERGKDVVKRYRDERDSNETDTKKFNILFSNTETLKPAVYSQVPNPDIRRRYQDKDPVGRLVATILQRATQYCIESYDFHSVLKRCRDDYLLPGFAIARAVYRPYLTGEGDAQQKAYEEVGTDYVPWDMFTMSRSKVYERVWWGATAEDLTRDEVESQFGAISADVSYGRRDTGSTDEGEEGKVRVWEVWCKRSRSRFYVAEGFDKWLRDPEADPLNLETFYPWPKPLWAVCTNDTLAPTPEYLQYQDQALELDDLTERIDVLTSALRRRGVYSATDRETLGTLAASTQDNHFVPIENWQALVEKGGLQNILLELPLDGIAKTILALDERREKVKQIIYEVTGISDIVRGASNAAETATAQQIKGRWAGLRISSRQSDFAVFARDLIRLKAEIIAERFDVPTLSLMTGIKLPSQQEKQMWQQMQAQQQAQMQQYQQVAMQAKQAGQQPPPPPQIQPPSKDQQQFYAQPTWEEVMKVLRSDKLRGFKVDIETDSTVQPDGEAEKAARVDLVQGIGQASQQLAGAVQVGLLSTDFAKELIAYVVRSYKAGSSMEDALDAMGQQQGMTPQQIQAQQQQLQQHGQDLQKRESQVQQREAQAKEAEHQAELQQKDLKNQSDKLAADRSLFAIEQKAHADALAMRETHAKHIHELGNQAEQVVREVVRSVPAPTAAPAAVEGPAGEKKERSSAALRDIHIHTGADKPAKKKGRKLRLVDQPDGSMLAEELEDAAPDNEVAEPGAM